MFLAGYMHKHSFITNIMVTVVKFVVTMFLPQKDVKPWFIFTRVYKLLHKVHFKN